MRQVLALSVLAAVLLGCSTVIRSNVTRFDELPESTAGKSVYFLPLEEQATSAAYRSYAGRVATELANYGMHKTDDLTTADFAIIMDFGVGGERQISGAVPLYGQTGGGTTFHSGSVSTFGSGGSSFGSYTGQSYSAPSFGILGMMPYTRTEYDRFFAIRMIDLARSTADKLVPVYEGNVLSTGAAASFDEVSGCLIQALFQDFRQTGSTHVDIGASECQ
jgi:hypothetical protein